MSSPQIFLFPSLLQPFRHRIKLCSLHGFCEERQGPPALPSSLSVARQSPEELHITCVSQTLRLRCRKESSSSWPIPSVFLAESSLSTSAASLHHSLLSTLHLPQQEAWAFYPVFKEHTSHLGSRFQMININRMRPDLACFHLAVFSPP